MDLEMYSCILVLEGDFVSAGHDGYCSGGDCEDTTTVETHYVTLECSSKTTIEQLKYLESINMLDELFGLPIDFKYFVGRLPEDSGGSGYCGPSESGRHHEADFTATKILHVLDYNANAKYVDPGWPVATINEKALDTYVCALITENSDN